MSINVLNMGKVNSDIINELKNHYEENGFDEKLRTAEKEIIRKNNYDLSYLFAVYFKEADVNTHADIVLASEDEDRIYDFICDVSNFDIKHFEDGLIELGNLSLLVNFARIMQGKFDISRISNIIFRSGDAKYNYIFAKDVSGVDINLHGQAVVKCNDPKYCYTYARDVDKENVLLYQNVVMQSGNPKWCYYFMRDVNGADIALLDKIIIDSGDLEYNYLACNVDGTDIQAHKEIIMNGNNELYINKLSLENGVLSLVKKRG